VAALAVPEFVTFKARVGTPVTATFSENLTAMSTVVPTENVPFDDADEIDATVGTALSTTTV
jgi:hypothetical protein